MSESSKTSMCLVRFGPEGPEIEVEEGTTILDAARLASVFIDSLCSGDGACGKCRVIVREGDVESVTTGLLTRTEIRQGYYLACEARVQSDVLVEVPAESQLKAEITALEESEEFVGVEARRERPPTKLDPLVNKHCITVPEPTLENNRADLERLEQALSEADGKGDDYQMGLKVIRTLPERLRKHKGSITVTTAYRGQLTEITEVAKGDSSSRNIAAVVDVGTTTIVVHLVDLVSGRTLGAAAKYNSQASYGADIIRRIMWCNTHSDGLRQLQKAIVNDMNILIQDLRSRHRVSSNDISVIVAAGNTTMMHMLLGINPEWIRREPYSGVAYQPPPFRAVELGLTVHPRGLLYCLPSVSSFVGADISAGVMASNLNKSETPVMLIDVGTNGEIVIGCKDWMVCASASAGPAFEGAGNRDGMRAMRGAIDHIQGGKYYGKFSYSTIGDAPPVGLCGTAYVDLLAELLRLQIIDKTGRLQMDKSTDRLREGENGAPEFVIVNAGEQQAKRDIVITQDDISNLVRSKGAIYAATKVLLNSLGLKMDDLRKIMVAGAFGNYLDLENAVSIGLLPDVPPKKLRFVGNTSVRGAKQAALNRERLLEVQQIADSMTYFELSTDPTFMSEFTSACFFPHTHVEEFPSVVAKLAGKG
ncbi:ASKHA domain-containing protein [Candidatus Hydrogenedentota bacterium]